MKVILAFILVCCTLFGFSTPAFAHSVETDYQVSPQAEMAMQAKFSTGEPFQQAPVKVYLPHDQTKPWLEGKTDDQGNFAFQIDRQKAGDWEVKIGQADHADILTVSVNDKGVEVSRLEPSYPVGKQLIALGFAGAAGVVGMRWLKGDRA